MAPKKQTGLGRGLSALLDEMGGIGEPQADGAAPSVPVQDASAQIGAQMLSLALITPNAKQPRRHFDEAMQAELIASVKRQGLLQPILVRPTGTGKFEIVAGERRWRAAQAAQLHEVPVLVRPLSDSEAFEIALVENIQRQDLNPIEEAEGYHRLIEEFGHTQDDIGKLVGKSRSHVANLIRLLDLPKDIRAAVIDGKLSMGHARALIGAPGASTLAKRIVKEGLSVREVEAIIRGDAPPRRAGSKTAKSARSADIVALERQLAEALGLRVKLEPKGEGGQLVLSYSDLDQLDMLCQRLSGERF